MTTEGNGPGELISAGQKRRQRHPVAQVARVPLEPVIAALPPRLLDLEGAATYLGVSPWTIRDLEAAGTLKRVSIPVGGKDLRKLLFDRADLDRLIEAWKA